MNKSVAKVVAKMMAKVAPKKGDKKKVERAIASQTKKAPSSMRMKGGC